jgi:hypothetical protein
MEETSQFDDKGICSLCGQCIKKQHHGRHENSDSCRKRTKNLLEEQNDIDSLLHVAAEGVQDQKRQRRQQQQQQQQQESEGQQQQESEGHQQQESEGQQQQQEIEGQQQQQQESEGQQQQQESEGQQQQQQEVVHAALLPDCFWSLSNALREYLEVYHLFISVNNSGDKAADLFMGINKLCAELKVPGVARSANAIRNSYPMLNTVVQFETFSLNVPHLPKPVEYTMMKGCRDTLFAGPHIDLKYFQALSNRKVSPTDGDSSERVFNSPESGRTYQLLLAKFPGHVILQLEFFIDSAFLSINSRAQKGSIDCIVVTCALFGHMKFSFKGGGCLVATVPTKSEISTDDSNSAWESLKSSPAKTSNFEKGTFAQSQVRTSILTHFFSNAAKFIGCEMGQSVKQTFEDGDGNKLELSVVFTFSLLQADNVCVREVTNRRKNWGTCTICPLTHHQHLLSSREQRVAVRYSEAQDARDLLDSSAEGLARLVASSRFPFPPIMHSAQQEFTAFLTIDGNLDPGVGMYTATADYIHCVGKGVMLDILKKVLEWVLNTNHVLRKPKSFGVDSLQHHCEQCRTMMAMQPNGGRSDCHKVDRITDSAGTLSSHDAQDNATVIVVLLSLFEGSGTSEFDAWRKQLEADGVIQVLEGCLILHILFRTNDFTYSLLRKYEQFMKHFGQAYTEFLQLTLLFDTAETKISKTWVIGKYWNLGKTKLMFLMHVLDNIENLGALVNSDGSLSEHFMKFVRLCYEKTNRKLENIDKNIMKKALELQLSHRTLRQKRRKVHAALGASVRSLKTTPQEAQALLQFLAAEKKRTNASATKDDSTQQQAAQEQQLQEVGGENEPRVNRARVATVGGCFSIDVPVAVRAGNNEEGAEIFGKIKIVSTKTGGSLSIAGTYDAQGKGSNGINLYHNIIKDYSIPLDKVLSCAVSSFAGVTPTNAENATTAVTTRLTCFSQMSFKKTMHGYGSHRKHTEATLKVTPYSGHARHAFYQLILKCDGNYSLLLLLFEGPNGKMLAVGAKVKDAAPCSAVRKAAYFTSANICFNEMEIVDIDRDFSSYASLVQSPNSLAQLKADLNTSRVLNHRDSTVRVSISIQNSVDYFVELIKNDDEYLRQILTNPGRDQLTTKEAGAGALERAVQVHETHSLFKRLERKLNKVRCVENEIAVDNEKKLAEKKLAELTLKRAQAGQV